ncbi:MAG: hypothetical protein Q9215_008027 [Flavoplaca cf. flavocitrina]
MPSTEFRFADCTFRFVEDFERRPSQALIKCFASMEDQANRPHRKAKVKKKHTGDKNPKAFAFASPGKLAKQAARSHDACFPSLLNQL